MAQFMTNFSENALGAGTPSGWTLDSGTPTGLVALDSTVPEFPRSFSFGTGGSGNYTFNAAGSVLNQEVLTACIFPAISNNINTPSSCRIQAGPNQYGAGPNDTSGVKSMALSVIVGGSSGIFGTAKVPVLGEVWFSRLRCSGGQISGTFWKYGTVEPASPDVVSPPNDPNITTAGKLGMRVSSLSGGKILFWSCGTNGDVAPFRPLHYKRARVYLRR
jgi:hypothetical protein